jgi:hypothetical protein
LLQAWQVGDIVKKVKAITPESVRASRPWQRKDEPYTTFSATVERARLPEGGLWGEVNLPAFATVLCADAVLAIHPAGGNKFHPADIRKNELQQWQLSALARESGQTLWTVDLAGRPAWNGLSVAANGSILIAHWDGSLSCFQ